MITRQALGLDRLLLDAVRAAQAAEAQASEAAPPVQPRDTAEQDSATTIDDDRLRAAIRHEVPLTREEQRRVLFSAELQHRIKQLRRFERMRAEDTAATAEAAGDRHWSLEPTCRVAAAEPGRAVEPVRLQPKGFTIDLIPIDADGKVWQLELLVHADVLEELRQLMPTGMRLVDSEGETWLSGRPDDDGRIQGYWEREDDLALRLERVSVAVAPA